MKWKKKLIYYSFKCTLIYCFSFIKRSYFPNSILVVLHLKDNGRMANVMDWALRHEDDGFIEANGHRASKGVMASGRAPHRQPNMRAHGQMDYRMAMVQRHMLMGVNILFLFRTQIYTCAKSNSNVNEVLCMWTSSYIQTNSICNSIISFSHHHHHHPSI